MKTKEWLNCSKTMTRRELLKLCLIASIPFYGFIGLMIGVIAARFFKKQSEWK